MVAWRHNWHKPLKVKVRWKQDCFFREAVMNMIICPKLEYFEQILPFVYSDEEPITYLRRILFPLIEDILSLFYLTPKEIARTFFEMDEKRVKIAVELKYVLVALLC